jgi:hypothetical protein
MAVKAKPGGFWLRVKAIAGVLMSSRDFLAGAGLVLLVLVLVGTANAMASRDSYYRLGAHGEDAHVWFTLNNGNAFTAASQNLDAFRPAWLPAEAFARLLDVRKEVRGMRIWDDNLFARLGAAIKASPSCIWVESTPVMTRRLPAFVQVSMVLRTPYAEVVQGNTSNVVDRQGMLLPTTPAVRSAMRLIRIEGIPDQPPAAGEIWKSEWLGDALGLMRDLQTGLSEGETVAALLEDIVRVKCEKVHERLGEVKKPGITLYHKDGCEILWELYTPGERAFGRPSNAIKMINLRKMLLEGRIENIASVKSIDLSVEDPIVIFRGKK